MGKLKLFRQSQPPKGYPVTSSTASVSRYQERDMTTSIKTQISQYRSQATETLDALSAYQTSGQTLAEGTGKVGLVRALGEYMTAQSGVDLDRLSQAVTALDTAWKTYLKDDQDQEQDQPDTRALELLTWLDDDQDDDWAAPVTKTAPKPGTKTSKKTGGKTTKTPRTVYDADDFARTCDCLERRLADPKTYTNAKHQPQFYLDRLGRMSAQGMTEATQYLAAMGVAPKTPAPKPVVKRAPAATQAVKTTTGARTAEQKAALAHMGAQCGKYGPDSRQGKASINAYRATL